MHLNLTTYACPPDMANGTTAQSVHPSTWLLNGPSNAFAHQNMGTPKMAGDADASRVAEHKMHLKRVKRRLTAAIQTTRVKWAVRCINNACPHKQAGGAVRVEEVVFCFQDGVSLKLCCCAVFFSRTTCCLRSIRSQLVIMDPTGYGRVHGSLGSCYDV